MKSYTDIEQSKKLGEILPIESADMVYIKHSTSSNQDWRFDDDIPPMILGKASIKDMTVEVLPCWSLAALIDILPEDIIGQRHYFFEISKMGDASTPHEVRYYRFREESDGGDFGRITWISRQANNLVDACVEMILKLHELKML